MTIDQRAMENLKAMLGDRDMQIAILAARLDDALVQIEQLKPHHQPDESGQQQ